MFRIAAAALVAATVVLCVGKGSAQAQGQPRCPRGERPLPETGLCPTEAIDAFLSKSLIRKSEFYKGCTYWVNETSMAGNVLLYGALRCGNWIGKLEVVPGAKPTKLMSRTKEGTQDVEVTVMAANPSDPKATINSFARNAIKDPVRRRECVSQDNPNVQGAIIFDLTKKAAARVRPEGPSGGECGDYGENNGPNHWRSFGGHVWYIGITDSEHSFDPNHMVLLERDTRGGGLKGWRVKF